MCYAPVKMWPPKAAADSRSPRIAEALGPVGPNGGRWVYRERDALKGSLPTLVPCNECLACKARRRRNWVTRLRVEMDDATRRGLPSWMVNLTYANEHLPDDFSVSRREMQLWLKKVRNEFGFPFRYYLCAEYGAADGGTKRPHYHALLFGLPLDRKTIEGECYEVRSAFMGLSLPSAPATPPGNSDLIPLENSQSGFPQWRSPRLESTWTDSKLGDQSNGNLKGRLTVCEVNDATLSYVAGYVTKKLRYEGGENPYLREHPVTGQILNVTPEFALMSRGGRASKGIGGGIGASFVERYKDTDLQHDFMVKDGAKIAMPSYFVNRRRALLLEEQGPEAVAAEKMHRAQMARDQAKLHAADNTPDRRMVRQEVHHLRTKSLARADESLDRLYQRSVKQ